MLISILLVILGFTSLIFGANWLVDGASALAKKYKVSDLAIGLTIVAFGTSAPELVVNLIASLNGYSDIILGNVIGSNNFNLFLILGLSAVIAPIAVQSSTAWREIPISLGITVLLFLLLNDFFLYEVSSLSRLEAVFLLGLFFLFLYYVFTQMKQEESPSTPPKLVALPRIWALIVIGLAGLILGGQVVITHSVSIATELGLSKKIIGLTIVAAGTSLPELVTSVLAALKKNSDIAIGNVIGSNIFNLLLILGVSGLVHPIDYSPLFNIDMYILLGGTTALLLFMLTGKYKRLDRWEAALLITFYLSYTIYLVAQEL